jgi:hypothetical protein
VFLDGAVGFKKAMDGVGRHGNVDVEYVARLQIKQCSRYLA